jgi:hypothetical protein
MAQTLVRGQEFDSLAFSIERGGADRALLGHLTSLYVEGVERHQCVETSISSDARLRNSRSAQSSHLLGGKS